MKLGIFVNTNDLETVWNALRLATRRSAPEMRPSCFSSVMA